MHFEVLVEDASGKKALDIIIPKIIGNNNTFKIHAYRGIGRIPKNITTISSMKNRILLEQLPRLLRGYGRSFLNYPAKVIVVCDLDNKVLSDFRQELLDVLDRCDPKPSTHFCIAIEEGEAWFLGDIPAIKAAYPNARKTILDAYVPDSICGSWECLAEAIYQGGATALSSKGWQAIGIEKSQWAEKISPHMNIQNNTSPSFRYFCETLSNFVE